MDLRYLRTTSPNLSHLQYRTVLVRSVRRLLGNQHLQPLEFYGIPKQACDAFAPRVPFVSVVPPIKAKTFIKNYQDDSILDMRSKHLLSLQYHKKVNLAPVHSAINCLDLDKLKPSTSHSSERTSRSESDRPQRFFLAKRWATTKTLVSSFVSPSSCLIFCWSKTYHKRSGFHNQLAPRNQIIRHSKGHHGATAANQI